MAITFTTNLTQSDRNSRVLSNPSTFYHLLDGEDINYAVEKMLVGSEQPDQPYTAGQKYLLLSTAYLSPAGSNVNDIVMWDGNKWVVHQKMTNSKTPFGLIFDKRTKKFYHYVDASTGWVPILRSGSVDGGTFG